jgi:hypothetical protein
MNTLHQESTDPLDVSGPLKPDKPDNDIWMTWLTEMTETSALIGGILSIVHPELYQAGMEALKKLSEDPFLVVKHARYMEIYQHWSSAFSGISVITNRETPIHRDLQARHQWYDVLVTLGEYTDGRMELPSLGIRLEYNPGTVVALAGKMIPHGVCQCDGERVCLAYFMRDNVHERAGVHAPDWMTTGTYGCTS